MQRKTLITIGVITLGCLLLGYCNTTIGPGHRGQVLDADTKQPIAGALVALYQSGDELIIVPHGGRVGVCFHSALTMTDSKGRFSFPPWIARDHYYKRSTVLFAYKPGYLIDATAGKTRSEYLKNTRAAKLRKWKAQKKLDPIEYLRRDVNTTRAPTDPGRGPVSLRVNYLYNKTIQELTCRGRKTRYPLYKAVYYEAARLAVTDKDRDYVRQICNKATGKSLHYHRSSRGKGTVCSIIADVPEEWRAWDRKVTALGSQQ